MAARTWIPGTVGDWFDAANWTTAPPDPNNFPQPGDTVAIPAGVAAISAGDGSFGPINHETITLGGPLNLGTPVTLQASGATFDAVSLRVSGEGGGVTAPVNATLLTQGSNIYAGQISVEPFAGSLTIDAESMGSTRGDVRLEASGSSSAAGGLVYVTQESALHLKGEQITNDALIQVEGTADIAAGLTIAGTGIIDLESGGGMAIAGAVGSFQELALPDNKSTLTLTDPGDFKALIGLGQYGGDRIDLPTIEAQSTSLDAGQLSLYAGPDQTGGVVAQLRVALINSGSLGLLPDSEQTLTAADFTLGAAPNGGTRLTYAPQGPISLEASLPVPIIATAGSLVPLSGILQTSFGTGNPGFYGMTLVPTAAPTTLTDYWGQPPDGTAIPPEWYVNGKIVATPTIVRAGDDVELMAGNNIHDPAQIQMQTTPSATGNGAEYVTYDVWTTDPAIEQAVIASGSVPGSPTAADILAAASAYAGVYPGVLNENLCNWIADDVAAAAGATMPLPNAFLDPSLNVEGGFWRIVYRGSSSATPVQDWGTLVQPGDVVRLQWNSGGGHTTTVLGIDNADGSLTVYDNIDKNAEGEHTIGIHDNVTYWTGTDPTAITIYRLDPNHQYLIQGTALGEFIQGSTFDNLIRPGGGADVITAGAGNNEIQDTAAHLDGITVTDFHAGDTLDFTDLDPRGTVVSDRPNCGTPSTLRVISDHKQVAALTLPNLPDGDSFIVRSDGGGGSLVELVPLGGAGSLASDFAAHLGSLLGRTGSAVAHDIERFNAARDNFFSLGRDLTAPLMDGR